MCGIVFGDMENGLESSGKIFVAILVAGFLVFGATKYQGNQKTATETPAPSPSIIQPTKTTQPELKTISSPTTTTAPSQAGCVAGGAFSATTGLSCSGDGSCVQGTTFDKTENQCVTPLTYCQNRNGINATYSSADNSCGCATGYTLDSNNTCTVQKNGYQVCNDMNATWDGSSYISGGVFNCTCKPGYSSTSDRKSCEPTQEQAAQPMVISNPASQGVIKSNIDGDFSGWEGETVYKLTNGQYWQQSSYYYYYSYAYDPEVLIYSSNGAYKMHVEGSGSEDVNVSQVAAIESRIDGDFNGWEGQTVYKLTNGQIWQQTDYHYHYHYAYSPEVLIYQSISGVIKMHVKGDTDQEISVHRIN